jgi:hypothetical protein
LKKVLPSPSLRSLLAHPLLLTNPNLVFGGDGGVDQVGDLIHNGDSLKKMEDDPNSHGATATMGGGAVMEGSEERYMFKILHDLVVVWAYQSQSSRFSGRIDRW